MAYNNFEHGQIIQSNMFECDEIHFISKGGVAVCESTCFGEPLLIYKTGAVINLYQVMMKQSLDFTFKAVSSDNFTI